MLGVLCNRVQRNVEIMGFVAMKWKGMRIKKEILQYYETEWREKTEKKKLNDNKYINLRSGKSAVQCGAEWYESGVKVVVNGDVENISEEVRERKSRVRKN
jgi:hypothetical protein